MVYAYVKTITGHSIRQSSPFDIAILDTTLKGLLVLLFTISTLSKKFAV